MLESHHAWGIKRLEAFISQFPDWRRLTSADLKIYESLFVTGWELPGLSNDISTQLRILVGSGFPFEPPRVAVFPAPPVLAWPNLEDKGLLCLLTEESAEQIESIAVSLLQGAQELVNEWHSKIGMERFEDEFQSYWGRWRRNTEQFVSLCATDGLSRWVYAFHERHFTVVADDKQTLKSWVFNYFTFDSKVTIQPIPLVRLSRPLRPVEYPNTVAELFAIIMSDADAIAMLQKLIHSNYDKRKGVLLAFPGRLGVGFAGIILPPNNKNIANGFRKGHIPARTIMQRYNMYSVKGASVTRCDSSWVHGRDCNPETSILGKKTVLLLGVGSLGSGVAELIAKMGISKLVLIDPETMETENASRHALGIRSASSKKATELTRNLTKRFPHLQFVSYSQRWEDCYKKNPILFTSANLIISTIGTWSAESSLNALALATKDFPPVLFGWLEEHAAAGHAVVFFEGNGCLRCLTDDKGYSRIHVTRWPGGETKRQIPMCGGMFQPYGAIELSYVQGLVADLTTDILLSRTMDSVHRVWIGQKKLLESGNGEWHPDWITCYGNPEDGGRIVNLSISSAPDCPICGQPG